MRRIFLVFSVVALMCCVSCSSTAKDELPACSSYEEMVSYTAQDSEDVVITVGIISGDEKTVLVYTRDGPQPAFPYFWLWRCA